MILSIFRIFMVLFVVALPGVAGSLTPDEVLVVANKNAARSVGLAKFYMERRDVSLNVAGESVFCRVSKQGSCPG